MTRRPIISRFALATLTPVCLLFLAATYGGLWAAAALVYMTALVAALDEVIAVEPVADGVEFPAAPWLSAALGVMHFPLLAVGIWALTGGTGLGWVSQGALYIALGLFFGQVSNSNAHELIHKPARGLRRLGMWVYISLLYGHHTSAHVRVHHIHVGSDRDPATARKGESFYAYALRAWLGGFAQGWRAETELRRKAGHKGVHPYVVYLGGAAAVIAGAYALAGTRGVLALILLAAYAQVQLLMSDYVQHYGLSRRTKDSGKLEPVGPRHSWNAPHVASAALMMNAPRHSDHHAHPARGYAELRIDEDMPMLPYALPVMATLALWPARWRKVMDPRAARWS